MKGGGLSLLWSLKWNLGKESTLGYLAIGAYEKVGKAVLVSTFQMSGGS